jgi:hypothetical protein
VLRLVLSDCSGKDSDGSERLSLNVAAHCTAADLGLVVLAPLSGTECKKPSDGETYICVYVFLVREVY